MLPLGRAQESKLIGERLVSQAVHSVSGLKAVSVRCGQLMGDHQTGVWNSDEWWPSVVRSATPGGLHSLPSGPQLGDVDWISSEWALYLGFIEALTPWSFAVDCSERYGNRTATLL